MFREALAQQLTLFFNFQLLDNTATAASHGIQFKCLLLLLNKKFLRMCRKQKEIIYLKIVLLFLFWNGHFGYYWAENNSRIDRFTLFLDWNINSYIFFSQYLQHQHKLSGFCLVSLKSKILFKEKHPPKQPYKHVPSALSSFVDYYKILTQQYILTGVHVS